MRAKGALGQADVDERERREAYQDAFLEAYDRFDAEVVVDDAPDPEAAEDRIESNVRAELEDEVADAAAEEFPGRSFAPFRRFVVDVEAAVPAGSATVFGRAAYSQGDAGGSP